MSRMLIVYYSVSNGNTRRIAEQMQQATGADIAEIRTVQPYTGSYQDIVDQGQREVERGYKPEIRPLAVDLADYDVIAVGTPTWWYTMAPAVKTFLESREWDGKTVIPFQTCLLYTSRCAAPFPRSAPRARRPLSAFSRWRSCGSASGRIWALCWQRASPSAWSPCSCSVSYTHLKLNLLVA